MGFNAEQIADETSNYGGDVGLFPFGLYFLSDLGHCGICFRPA